MFYSFLKTQQKPDYYAFEKILQWTSEPPTQAGWYWVIAPGYLRGLQIVEVVDIGYGLEIFDDRGNEPVALGKYWLGALPIPELPTKES